MRMSLRVGLGKRRLLGSTNDLINATVARTGTRTVSAYATGAVIADGETLVVVAANEPALAGYRYLGAGNGWSTVDAAGFQLPDLRGLSVGVSGQNSATDDDKWSEPTPSVLTPQKGAIRMQINPDATGQLGIPISSQTDTDNGLRVIIFATTISIRKRVSGVDDGSATISYTHTSGTMLDLEVFWDDVLGIGIRAADSSSDITLVSFLTDTDTQDVPLGSSVEIGNRDSGTFFQGTYKAPIFYASKEAAGW